MGKTRVRKPQANRTYAVYRKPASGPRWQPGELVAVGLSEKDANEYARSHSEAYPENLYDVTGSPEPATKG